MSIQLVISSIDFGPVRVFKLTGYLAQLEVYRFKRAVENSMVDGKRAVIANLETIEYIDSAGIASLIYMRKEGDRANCRAALIVKPGSGVAKVLASTNMGNFMRVYSSQQEALEDCGISVPAEKKTDGVTTEPKMIKSINSNETVIESS